MVSLSPDDNLDNELAEHQGAHGHEVPLAVYESFVGYKCENVWEIRITRDKYTNDELFWTLVQPRGRTGEPGNVAAYWSVII